MQRIAWASVALLVLVAIGCEAGQAVTGSSSKDAVGPAWVYHQGSFYWPGDYSFNARPFYGDKEGAAPSGRGDIKVTVTGEWGGFQPFARNYDFDVRPYAFFTFAFKPTRPDQTLQLYFHKPGDQPIGNVINPLKYGPPPVPGQWATYKIPIADIGVTGMHVYKFAIQDETGLKSNVFYLDEIGFLP